MCIMIPVLAINTLNHKLVLYLGFIFFRCKLTMAIDVKEWIIVLVLIILIVFLCLFKLARKRHSWVSTITTKSSFICKFMDFMTFVTCNHTSQTYPMSLNFFSYINLLYTLVTSTKLLYIACLTRIYRLVSVATFISALLDIFYSNGKNRLLTVFK